MSRFSFRRYVLARGEESISQQQWPWMRTDHAPAEQGDPSEKGDTKSMDQFFGVRMLFSVTMAVLAT
jgi:hypothetical protein